MRPVNTEYVRFYLFRNPGVGKMFTSLNEEIIIKPEHPVKIFLHGGTVAFRLSGPPYSYEPIVKAYLEKGNVNIITVEWYKFIATHLKTDVKAIEYIGERIADMVTDLAERYHISFKNIHLIGYWRGASIAGYAGRTIMSKHNIKLGRITGLDPFGIVFRNINPGVTELCSTDADFIDIIHTEGGFFGEERSIGHIYFYPNGGTRAIQGCILPQKEHPHNGAPVYFAESINSYDFVAVNTPSYSDFKRGNFNADCQRAVMGENVDPCLRGHFYIYTNKEAPLARGPI